MISGARRADVTDALRRGTVPQAGLDEKALQGLKFSEALPRHLAEATLAARLADLEHAAEVLAEPVSFER